MNNIRCIIRFKNKCCIKCSIPINRNFYLENKKSFCLKLNLFNKPSCHGGRNNLIDCLGKQTVSC